MSADLCGPQSTSPVSIPAATKNKLFYLASSLALELAP